MPMRKACFKKSQHHLQEPFQSRVLSQIRISERIALFNLTPQRKGSVKNGFLAVLFHSFFRGASTKGECLEQGICSLKSRMRRKPSGPRRPLARDGLARLPIFGPSLAVANVRQVQPVVAQGRVLAEDLASSRTQRTQRGCLHAAFLGFSEVYVPTLKWTITSVLPQWRAAGWSNVSGRDIEELCWRSKLL